MKGGGCQCDFQIHRNFYDYADLDSDSMDQAEIERVQGVLDTLIERAKGASNYEALKRRGEQLPRRLDREGILREPVVVIVGKIR